MKKTTLTAIAAALVIGAVGFTSISPAFARGGPEGHGPRINFEELDTNGDGLITVEEMEAHKATQFTEQDTNGDGFLSKEELLSAAAERAAERMAERVDHMIERKDANDDGQISLAELKNDERSGRFFEHLDADGDGAVSKAEMDAAKEKRFGKRQKPASE